VAEPEQGLEMQLAYALRTEAHGGPKAAEGGWRVIGEAVVGHHEVAQSSWQPGQQVVKGGVPSSTLPGGEGIWLLVGARSQKCLPSLFWPRLGEALSRFDRSPDVPHEAGPGIGGEGRAALGIVVQDSLPEAKAACLQGLGEG
jgi:hypothetical protein